MRAVFLTFTAAALLVSTAVMAADLPIEISAAQMTARSGSRNVAALDEIHRRMQSAINCLVGPGGEGYDAKAPNPCAPSGNGVIPDTADPAAKAKYREAVDKLKSGLTVDKREDAMQIALDGADMIVAASGN